MGLSGISGISGRDPGGNALSDPQPLGAAQGMAHRRRQRKASFWGMNDRANDHGYNGIITMVIISASAIRRLSHLQALLLM
jgi:hypothetical protein